jgi:hypothetical protein
MGKPAQFRLTLFARTADTTGLVTFGTPGLSGTSTFATASAALGSAERKLIGVVLSEFQPTTINRQRDKQYA